jgi:hypothetical protein
MPYVSEYHVSRHYGGPEEGGWWYDWDSYQRTICLASSPGDAQMIARALNEESKREKRDSGEHDRFSAIGSDDVVYFTEDTPGEYQTKEHPHYE